MWQVIYWSNYLHSILKIQFPILCDYFYLKQNLLVLRHFNNLKKEPDKRNNWEILSYMQLPINNFTFLIYCTFSGCLAQIHLFPLLTNFNSFDDVQTLGNHTTFAGLGSDMHPINNRMQTVLTISLQSIKDNSLYEMHCLDIYLYGQETVSPLNCTPNHVLFFVGFFLKNKKIYKK